MKSVGLYDGNLQMFSEPARELDLGKLRFLRWLAEHNRLEHGTVGPSSGEIPILFSGGQADATDTQKRDQG
jgi:hypothetical protein